MLDELGDCKVASYKVASYKVPFSGVPCLTCFPSLLLSFGQQFHCSYFHLLLYSLIYVFDDELNKAQKNYESFIRENLHIRLYDLTKPKNCLIYLVDVIGSGSSKRNENERVKMFWLTELPMLWLFGRYSFYFSEGRRQKEQSYNKNHEEWCLSCHCITVRKSYNF